MRQLQKMNANGEEKKRKMHKQTMADSQELVGGQKEWKNWILTIEVIVYLPMKKNEHYLVVVVALLMKMNKMEWAKWTEVEVKWMV